MERRACLALSQVLLAADRSSAQDNDTVYVNGYVQVADREPMDSRVSGIRESIVQDCMTS